MKLTTTTVLFAAAALVAACSDNSVAPKSHALNTTMTFGGGYTAALTQGDTARFSITITPYQATYYALGDGNNLTFPAGSVCDPSSSYGATEWNNTCTPLSSDVTVNVTEWLDAAGHARVDFQPHLRFVPSVVATNWVTITFADLQASLSAWPTILYCPTDVSSCYDESKSDPTMVTVANAVTGHLTRRIKHFSGYMVGAGDDGMSGLNLKGNGPHLPSALIRQGSTTGVAPSSNRTGYMLASGRDPQ